MARVTKLEQPPQGKDFDFSVWRSWFDKLYQWQRKEGKWTPTYTGLTTTAPNTYTTDAIYYKVGNIVTVKGRLIATGGTTLQNAGFGTMYINNPPFTVQQELAGVNAGDFYESFGRVFNASTGTDYGPLVAVYYTPTGTYDSRIYFPAFGPTAANAALTWEISYQTNA